MGKVFTNRYEIKYIVPTRSLAYIRNSLKGLIVPDVPDSYNFGQKGYYNYSIYFDTLKYKFYSEKHEGLLYRIKPRIRVYRETLDSNISSVFLEFKISFNDSFKKCVTKFQKWKLTDLKFWEWDFSMISGAFLYAIAYLVVRLPVSHWQ